MNYLHEMIIHKTTTFLALATVTVTITIPIYH